MEREGIWAPPQAPHPQAPLHHPLWPRQQPFLLWASAGLGPCPKDETSQAEFWVPGPSCLLSVSS